MTVFVINRGFAVKAQTMILCRMSENYGTTAECNTNHWEGVRTAMCRCLDVESSNFKTCSNHDACRIERQCHTRIAFSRVLERRADRINC